MTEEYTGRNVASNALLSIVHFAHLAVKVPSFFAWIQAVAKTPVLCTSPSG